MGTIIRRSVTPLNCSRTLQAVRGYETVCATLTTTPAGRCGVSVESS
jgi:hypothetical protein